MKTNNMKTNNIGYIVLIGIILILGIMLYMTPNKVNHNIDKILMYKDSLEMYKDTIGLKDEALKGLSDNYIFLASSYDSLIKQKRNLEQEHKSNTNEIKNATVTDDELWLNSHFSE